MAVNLVLVPGNNIQLLCQAHSNVAQMHWRLSGQILRPNDKYYYSDWGLLIVGASTSDAGLYICDSVEQTAGRIHNRTVAAYQLQLSPVDTTTAATTHKINIKESVLIADNHLAKQQSFKVTILVVSVILLSLTCFSLIGVVIWNWKRGRLRCFKVAQNTFQSQGERHPDEHKDIQDRSSENSCHRMQSIMLLNAINNHSAVHLKGRGGQSSTQTPNTSSLHRSGCIQESEI
ncbi:semaphorin-4E-like [Nelusetta ayraudi]|uniref:semaphorin-4E-like n=1 Tax=Nelusetta ayraudi TaxID=303726 RepID=UPI003F723EBB